MVTLEGIAETTSPAAAAALKVGRLLGDLETYVCGQSDIIIDYATARRRKVIPFLRPAIFGPAHITPRFETVSRKQSTLWQIPKPQKSETGHSTQKPVECMRRPIENNSNPGQAVYGPFSGSGTTIIAAEMTGRACYAIELNPPYVDVAIKRWQDYRVYEFCKARLGRRIWAIKGEAHLEEKGDRWDYRSGGLKACVEEWPMAR